MYLRAVRLAGSPEALAAAAEAFDQVSSPVRELSGCVAVALAVDRQAGKGLVLSYWESEQAMQASEQVAARARATTTSEHGIDLVEVEHYEVTLLERRQPLKAGTFARVITSQVAPDKADEIQREMREKVLPAITGQKGLRSIVTAINRQNGKLIGGTSWDTAADREASNVATAPLRDELITGVGGGSPPLVENYDVVFADVRVTAGTGSS